VTPLHYRIIPEIAYDQNCTMMISTNTFLRGFAKRANPYDFYAMRYIFCGAEALSDAVFETYSKIYGVRVLTGYGATECAPVITMNNSLENQHGTVGKFLPGIEYKIMPVEGIDHQDGRAGKLYVRGKNVMRGYLNNEKANHKFLVEDQGWYDTGDVVELTPEGFVKICDRLKRFAKISGEMISLTAVEEALSPLLKGRKEIAVLSVPDEVKGEKLIVVTNLKDLDAGEVRRTLKAQGFSELVCPRVIHYLEEIPKLGNGKTNYVLLNEITTRDLTA
jgi:acyl-[acyl-carrier-protein]-phospholipid O-acyltransferase/long-chain-fatty-acid--[acyl-carrier-protein] ligase